MGTTEGSVGRFGYITCTLEGRPLICGRGFISHLSQIVKYLVFLFIYIYNFNFNYWDWDWGSFFDTSTPLLSVSFLLPPFRA